MRIVFTHNWNNKLSNDIFTTIRKYESGKYSYYSDKIGQPFDVVLKGKKVGEAKLVGLWKGMLLDIPLPFLFTDTGYSDLSEAYSLFRRFKVNPTDQVLVLAFEKKE